MILYSKLIFAVLLITTFSSYSYALGNRPPKPSPSAAPAPTPSPVTQPASPSNPADPADVQALTSQVDKYFSSSELSKSRASVNSTEIDQCLAHPPVAFSDSISWAVKLRMQNHRSRLGYVASAYGLPANEAQFAPVSLFSHRFCPVTAASLNTTLGGSSRVPSATVITKLNTFIDDMNSLRTQALNGDSSAVEKLELKWTKLFMCLSYTESLTTADTSASYNVASKLAPAGYRKPAGVKFYDDPAQTQASRYNIGLFQFTPTASGNIQACLREWNDNVPQCAISPTSAQSTMVKTLGSSQQAFNAFCGVSKITGMFTVQVNTSALRSTHPSNILSSGNLKSATDRCVSLHFAAGRSYNHFGPLQNTTGKNLDHVFSCLLKN